MDLQERIIVNPDVLVGKPVIKGTRISVELILKLLAKGISNEEILDSYPHLLQEDIFACIDYAAQRIAEDEFYQLTAR